MPSASYTLEALGRSPSSDAGAAWTPSRPVKRRHDETAREDSVQDDDESDTELVENSDGVFVEVDRKRPMYEIGDLLPAATDTGARFGQVHTGDAHYFVVKYTSRAVSARETIVS
ncbi:hypothetical protein H9P43_009675 [Blastocladiella emersonii ATCC 22665]|nr:hypothetical protein H9P43_009675 [Blastocladiella emersonii ATCC 22665]